MKREDIAELPLYPEGRFNRCPTAEQIFRLFSLVQRHVLIRGNQQLDRPGYPGDIDL